MGLVIGLLGLGQPSRGAIEVREIVQRRGDIGPVCAGVAGCEVAVEPQRVCPPLLCLGIASLVIGRTSIALSVERIIWLVAKGLGVVRERARCVEPQHGKVAQAVLRGRGARYFGFLFDGKQLQNGFGLRELTLLDQRARLPILFTAIGCQSCR